MSKSTPRDLAVAFRSLTRRLREAQDDETPPDAVASAEAEVRRVVDEAATLLGTASSPDAIANAIEARQLSDWNDSDLAALQAAADRAARAIRTVQNLSERA